MYDLRVALESYLEELEEPVVRAAIYTGEFDSGKHAGEDAERMKIAARLREILTDEDID